MKSFTKEDVSKHNKENDCWIIVGNKVYDVTSFLEDHPGGKNIVLKMGGKDSTKQFHSFHNVDAVLSRYSKDLLVGSLVSGSTSQESGNKSIRYIAHSEPPYLFEWNSPYLNKSHFAFQKAIRAWVDANIIPFVDKWDAEGEIPSSVRRSAFSEGHWLPGCIGAPWPSKELIGVDSPLPGGINPKEYDPFHEMILLDELSRCGSTGLTWGLTGGLSIGLPPIVHFGSNDLKKRICGPCLRGEKVICLAITEPSAGSDVAGIATEAKFIPEKDCYVVNGEKKWITNGTFADFFVSAVKTKAGMSLFVIEKDFPGVTVRKMKCSGTWGSGTSYITFEDVPVPRANLIGKEGEAFKYIMYNFNHERYGLICQGVRMARICYEDAFAYASKRRTFGKRLLDHDVIRYKFATMARQIESAQGWMESITYQMKTMAPMEQRLKLGGPMMLLKAHTSETLEYCAKEASQIFGGLSYTMGGQGGRVERISREVRAYSIPAGSLEIMQLNGIKMAIRRSKL